MRYNEEYERLSEQFDKAKAFDALAALFYDRNFGSATKSEIDLLMFSFYLDATIAAHTNEQNVLDYTQVSDYQIGQQLGITPEKVRNLKVKKQVRYPVEFDWKKSLETVRSNIRLDNKRIIIPISDPNLQNAIRKYINENGGFVDVESGRDYLRIRIEYYLMLMYYTLNVEDQKAFRKEMKKQLKKSNTSEDAFDDTNKMELANNILSLINSGIGTVQEVTSLFKPKNTLASILCELISLMNNTEK